MDLISLGEKARIRADDAVLDTKHFRIVDISKLKIFQSEILSIVVGERNCVLSIAVSM